jgi:hypothetical protein
MIAILKVAFSVLICPRIPTDGLLVEKWGIVGLDQL